MSTMGKEVMPIGPNVGTRCIKSPQEDETNESEKLTSEQKLPLHL